MYRCSLLDIWGAVLLSLEQLVGRGLEAGLVCVVDWSECPAKLAGELSPRAIRLVLDGLQVNIFLLNKINLMIRIKFWTRDFIYRLFESNGQ